MVLRCDVVVPEYWALAVTLSAICWTEHNWSVSHIITCNSAILWRLTSGVANQGRGGSPVQTPTLHVGGCILRESFSVYKDTEKD